MYESKTMERRKFIKSVCALGGVALVGSVLIESCQKPTPINFTLDLTAAANAPLKNLGGSVVNTANSIIIIRTGTSAYSALSNVCTHNGCTVGYQSNSQQLYCPCHGGTFDINGKVLAGPPPTPLTKYTVSLSGNILTVSG